MSAWLHDTADAAEFSDEKMAKHNLYESPRMFCDVYCLKPGQTQKPHLHSGEDKIYFALSGCCHVQIGEGIAPLPPGNLAVAPAGVEHGLENRSDGPARVLVVMAPHPSMKK